MHKTSLCVVLKWDDRLQKTQVWGKARSDFYHSFTFGTWKSSEAFDLSSEGNLRGGEPLVRRVPFNEVALERPWFGIKAALCLKRAKLTGCRPVWPLWNWVRRKWSFYLEWLKGTFFISHHLCPQSWPKSSNYFTWDWNIFQFFALH